MPTMYYAVTVPGREMISSSKTITVPRYWAKKYTEEAGGRAIVVKAVEYYAGGYRVPDKGVDVEDFMP